MTYAIVFEFQGKKTIEFAGFETRDEAENYHWNWLWSNENMWVLSLEEAKAQGFS